MWGGPTCRANEAVAQGSCDKRLHLCDASCRRRRWGVDTGVTRSTSTSSAARRGRPRPGESASKWKWMSRLFSRLQAVDFCSLRSTASRLVRQANSDARRRQAMIQKHGFGLVRIHRILFKGQNYNSISPVGYRILKSSYGPLFFYNLSSTLCCCLLSLCPKKVNTSLSSL